MFRIKPHTRQKHSEGSKKIFLCTRTQGAHRDCARPAFECLSDSCGDMDQQWPATGAGALGVADLGHRAWGTSPIGKLPLTPP